MTIYSGDGEDINSVFVKQVGLSTGFRIYITVNSRPCIYSICAIVILCRFCALLNIRNLLTVCQEVDVSDNKPFLIE